jgi:hypothetical protein
MNANNCRSPYGNDCAVSKKYPGKRKFTRKIDDFKKMEAPQSKVAGGQPDGVRAAPRTNARST